MEVDIDLSILVGANGRSGVWQPIGGGLEVLFHAHEPAGKLHVRRSPTDGRWQPWYSCEHQPSWWDTSEHHCTGQRLVSWRWYGPPTPYTRGESDEGEP